MTTSEAAEIVHTLRAGSRNFQELSAKAEKEYAARKQALARSREAELQRMRAEQKSRVEEIQSRRQAWLEQLARETEIRAARIAKAHAARKRKVAERIDETEGRRKFAVQKGQLDTERSRTENLAAAKKEIEEFRSNAERWQQALDELTRRFQKTFRGYLGFRSLLGQAAADDFPGEASEDKLMERVDELHRKASSSLKGGLWNLIAKFFAIIPVWALVLSIGLVAAVGPLRLGISNVEPRIFYSAAGIAAGLLVVIYLLGRFFSHPAARTVAEAITEAKHLLGMALVRAEARFEERTQSVRDDFEARIAAFQSEWKLATSDAAEARIRNETESSADDQRAFARHERLQTLKQNRALERFNQAMEAETSKAGVTEANQRAAHEAAAREMEHKHESQAAIVKQQQDEMADALLKKLERAAQFATAHFAPWTAAYEYQPPQSPLNVVKFGEFAVPKLSGNEPRVAAPLNLVFPREGNLLIETDDSGRPKAIDTLNNVVLRILATIPPGKVSFTFVDPVRLGESFSSIMHLADFEENMVNRRIWTEPAEIDERLFELNTHMEKVIQMYLRNDFDDIVAYNQQAGRIAEKYYFLVLADFPTNLGETAMRRLSKIMASGARCGVYVLAHWNKRQGFPSGFDAADFIQSSVHLQITREGIRLPRMGQDVEIRLDAPPDAELTTKFLHAAGQAHSGSNVVQVPFSDIAPAPGEYWTVETTGELRVPIGRSGATKLQYLSLGKGTRQHVLIAGKTGSGKSTLLHVLITNLALRSSPDQVQFYLVDFKKGVEFKDYALANLPHARVIAIESDRDFGLSVLRNLDEELRQRGELFRAAGAQDIIGYKEGGRVMPRILLVVDEFQELFVEDDSISQNAALLLDRIVRQGRAFGIHVVLGSQTLGGAYSLARSTLGQMVVRIALQSNEADAYLIMDENNPAPRLLSRPGEGIYNDASGRIEANSPFQVVWLGDKERQQALGIVRSLASVRGEHRQPIVFEGNHPAEIRENLEIQRLLSADAPLFDSAPRIWLGLPNEIKGPTEVLLDARSGRNLLVVGQQEDGTRALLAAAMLSLAVQPRLANARFVVLEAGLERQHLLERLSEVIPQEVRAPKGPEIEAVLRALREDLEAREAGASGPPTFLVIHNLSAFKPLRAEDDFSLSYDDKKESAPADFLKVLTEGPPHGIHVIAHVDSFNNVNRFLGRKGLREFHARVLFQMSAADSASLCDDPRASNLGLNRALLYEEQAGAFELFRPYARPNPEWLDQYRAAMRQRAKKTGPSPLDAHSGPSTKEKIDLISNRA